MHEVYVVRHRVLVERVPIRRLSREMGISRNTIKRYLRGAEPGVGRPRGAAGAPVRDAVRPRAEEILDDSKRWTAGKQRLTAARLYTMLVGEGHDVGYTVVKQIVREWKRRKLEVFVPLVYRAGDLGEVDFFEVLVDIAGERRKAHMFVLRLMHSKRDFAWLYPRQDQTCFLDGHVRAFAHFGAVVHRLAYDNLKAAVAKILVGSERELAPRFLALTTHYLFEASFARPRTGHDKGGVESRGKSIRWQHLVPIPRGDDLVAMRASLLARLDGAYDAERVAAECAKSLPLPAHAFDARHTHTPSASRRSLVCVEGAVYSVPCEWACLDVTAHVGVDDVAIVGPSGTVHHARKRFGERSIDYRHYVRELAKKPQAVRQVAAELIRDLGPAYGAAWRSLVDAHGPKQAARIFAKVLTHVEERGAERVAETIVDALARSEPLLLALAPPDAHAPGVASDSLPQSLRGIEIASSSAADFDAILIGGER